MARKKPGEGVPEKDVRVAVSLAAVPVGTGCIELRTAIS